MPTGLWLYSFAALWLLGLAVGAIALLLVREVGHLYSYWVHVEDRPEWGLPPGAIAPALPSQDLLGRPLLLGSARGKKTLLYFLSRGCTACYAAAKALPELVLREDVELVLIVSASSVKTQLFLADVRKESPIPDVAVVADGEREVHEAYHVKAVPYAMMVDEDGRIGAKASTAGMRDVDALVRATEGTRAWLRDMANGHRDAQRAPAGQAVASEGEAG